MPGHDTRAKSEVPATPTSSDASWPCCTCGTVTAQLRDLPLRDTSPRFATLCDPCWTKLQADTARATAPATPSASWPCCVCASATAIERDLPLRATSPQLATLCGPCWAESGGQAGAEEIDAPPRLAMSVRTPAEQKEVLDLFAAAPWVSRLHRPTQARVKLLVTALVHRADWSTYTTRPTWATLCEVTGWARSTMAGWLRQLRILGWIYTVEHGSTPQTRPMGSPSSVEGNRAAVYLLQVPIAADQQLAESGFDQAQEPADGDDVDTEVVVPEHVDLRPPVGKNWTPSWSFNAFNKTYGGGSLRESEFFTRLAFIGTIDAQIEALRARLGGKARGFEFAGAVPETRAEMYAAACELRRQHPVLSRMSTRAVRALGRAHWLAGWSNDDLLFALKYRPTSWNALPGDSEYDVIHPLLWAKARLAAWIDDRGRILPGQAEKRTARVVDAWHARQAKLTQPAPQAADQGRATAKAALQAIEQQRQERRAAIQRTALQAETIAKAHAHLGTDAASPVATLERTQVVPVDHSPVSPAERQARAQARARAEGRGGFRARKGFW